MMTPALLSSLADTHRQVHDPKAKRRNTADSGSTADLMMLANMKVG